MYLHIHTCESLLCHHELQLSQAAASKQDAVLCYNSQPKINTARFNGHMKSKTSSSLIRAIIITYLLGN